MTPLDFMLKIMRDPNEDPERRCRMAVAAAPYVHRKAANIGKKELAMERARLAAGGLYEPRKAPSKYAPAAPPILRRIIPFDQDRNK